MYCIYYYHFIPHNIVVSPKEITVIFTCRLYITFILKNFFLYLRITLFVQIIRSVTD